ncbi:DUF2892 domain-containing protein [Pontibacillus salicampi]|uniref:DUF2892 domain-containing protein n=1 Tax=Pontibacillus salicampi TaxID=1449801 RepID=A0ABV6LMM9_9BACI
MVRPNIGIINAMIRITVGLTMLSYTTARLIRKPWRQNSLFMAMIGAMKVAEGIVRYCPVTALMEGRQEKRNQKEQESFFNPS